MVEFDYGNSLSKSDLNEGMKLNVFDEKYYFGEVYQNYDEFLDWKEMADTLIKRFPSASLLDIGCGCGNLVKEIKQQAEKKAGETCDIQGVDISDYAVKKANLPYIQLASCQKLPFADRRFETVFVLTTFSYLSDEREVRQAMNEAYRVAMDYISFEDVYTVPEVNTDDYDPKRKLIFSQTDWLLKWREILKPSDRIKTVGEEIIIRKIN